MTKYGNQVKICVFKASCILRVSVNFVLLLCMHFVSKHFRNSPLQSCWQRPAVMPLFGQYFAHSELILGSSSNFSSAPQSLPNWPLWLFGLQKLASNYAIFLANSFAWNKMLSTLSREESELHTLQVHFITVILSFVERVGPCETKNHSIVIGKSGHSSDTFSLDIICSATVHAWRTANSAAVRPMCGLHKHH